MCGGLRWVGAAAFNATPLQHPSRRPPRILRSCRPHDLTLALLTKGPRLSSSGLGSGGGGNNDDASIGHRRLKYCSSGGYPTGNQNWTAGNRLPIKPYDLWITTKMTTPITSPIPIPSCDRKYYIVGSGCAHALG